MANETKARTTSHRVSLLYVPCASEDEALRICRALLDERLVACGNIHETRSIYRWNGELADEREFVLICKTTPDRAEAAATKARTLHSYEVPCVLRIEPSGANYEYAAWVRGEVSQVRSAERGLRSKEDIPHAAFRIPQSPGGE
jgi:periplasmic divalent cation tolerance protein